jgi:hypothetical protein
MGVVLEGTIVRLNVNVCEQLIVICLSTWGRNWLF